MEISKDKTLLIQLLLSSFFIFFIYFLLKIFNYSNMFFYFLSNLILVNLAVPLFNRLLTIFFNYVTNIYKFIYQSIIGVLSNTDDILYLGKKNLNQSRCKILDNDEIMHFIISKKYINKLYKNRKNFTCQ